MPLKSKGLISELSEKIKTLIVRNSVLGRINTLEYFLRPFNITQNITIKKNGDAAVPL